MPDIRRAGSIIEKRWVPRLVILASFISMLVYYGPTDNWSWDPSFYYAQLRSPIIEHDLDFRPETKTSGIEVPYTATGLQGSPWPIGPSILWSPFFLVAHAAVLLIDPAKTTGFSSPYIALVSFSSALYGLAGLWVLYRTCRLFTGKYISLITLFLCLGATPLFYYIFHQTFMAHAAGFLVAGVMFLYYILLSEGKVERKWGGLALGVLLGLNFLMRWAGALFVVFPIMYFTSRYIREIRAKNTHGQKALVLQGLVAAASFLLTISPQLALWQRLYGSFLVMPQGPEAFVESALPVNFLSIFFHTNRGLLFWSPFVLLGMLGVWRIPNREVRISTAVCLLLQLVVIGYRVDWFSGGGFGARYFVELLPLLAVGFICLVNGWAQQQTGQVALAILALVLVLHQSVLMYAVEQTANGWLDIEVYLKGRPLGLKWQLDSFISLLKEPGLWLVPRSFIHEQRQSILVNLVNGVSNPRSYVIQGVAAVLTPLAGVVGLWLSRNKERFSLPATMVGVVVVMVAWMVFFLLIG
jgi:4-amino-4-deoxy-L-arabinose transferase-like glycosyltransferase